MNSTGVPDFRDQYRPMPFPSCAACPLCRVARRSAAVAARPRPPDVRVDWGAQVAVRRKLWLAGLLDQVPSLDAPLGLDEEQGQERAPR